MGDAGVQPVTVSRYTAAGDIVLKDAEGTEHPMTPEDVARFRAPLPTGEPNAPTPEAAGAPPAAEAAPAEGAAGPAVPPAATEAAHPEPPPVSYEMAGEGVPATMEDLEHVAELERAAAAGAPASAEPALATAEATLAQQAQGEPAETPQPTAVERRREPPIEPAQPATRSLIDRLSTERYLTGTGRNMTVSEPGALPQAPEIAPVAPTETAPNIPENIPRAPAGRTESATEPERAAPAPLQYRPIREEPETAFIPATGAAIPVSHVIADVRDLVTSHNDDLSPNPAYPQALQPRNRERAETEAQIASILNGGREGAFRPELLGETPDAANGAPIVGPEGYVEGGNARTMALRRAYERGLPQAEQYRNYLASQGYPIEGIANPVLVRLDRSGADMPQREQLARDLNVPPQAAMSATEQAMADARQIPTDLLRSYVGGDVFSGQNKPFWGGILRAVSHPSELPALTDPSGDLSRAGRARVQNALLAKAYGDTGIISSLTEDADSNIKAIGSALSDAAPTWAQLREAVAQGRVPHAYDLTSPLLEAVRLVQHARETGRNVAEFVNQRDMLGGGLSPETESMLSWMLGAPDWTRRYGREKMADALTEYAESAQRQPGMLGQPRPQPLELTEQARERAQGASRDLFAASLVEPGGAAAVRARAGENGAEAPRPENDPAGATAPETGAEGAGDRQGGLGLAEDIAAPADAFRNTRADWDAYRANTAFPNTPEANQMAAREYVRQRGTETGNEHIAVYDPQWGGITHVGTSDRPDRVSFATPGLDERLADPNASLVIHHNHPGDRAASVTDIAALGHPGVGAIVAHAHGPDVFAASLSPEAKAGFDQHLDRPGSLAAARAPYDAANRIVRSALTMQVLGDKLAPEAAERLQADMVNRALDAAGFSDYVSTRGSEGLSAPVYRSIISRAAREAQDAMAGSPRTAAALRGDVRARLDRSTVVFQPDAAMAAISRIAAGGERGPAGTAVADTGAGRVGAAAGRDEAVVAELREGTANPFGLNDEAISAPERRVEEIAGPPTKPPPPGLTRRFLRQFGSAPESPGAPERWFNSVQRLLIAPSNAARYDLGGVSRQKWDAENGRDLRSEALLTKYKGALKPYLSLSLENQRQITAALELLRLQGREVPADGRAIVAENARAYDSQTPMSHQPLAQNSKPGDVIRLTTPAQIAGYAAYRRAMDGMYGDVIAATAKRYGWDGEPTYKAISARAEEIRQAGNTAESQRLDRVAKMIGAIEFARRTAYTPFMRQGDYYFRVLPKAGTPDKPGVQEWTGDYPPVVWASRIDSRLPEEKVLGGARTASATANAYREELKRVFPEDQYEIQEGYHHPVADKLRAMDVESIEDLFQIMNRDVRREWRDRIRNAADPEAERVKANEAQELHDRAVNALLDQVYEQMKAGFKRRALNIPGYEPDLAQTTGVYTNWIADHIADLEYRERLHDADEAVDKSYDPLARGFWTKWDADQDRTRSPLDFGLSRLRQGAFYWTLAGNLGSSLKILLHGPMLGFPMLSTGLTPLGRARAAATYAKTMGQIVATIRPHADRGVNVSPIDAAKTPDERTLVAENEANGRLHQSGADELADITRHGIETTLSPQQRFNRRFLTIWASNIASMDRTMRASMLLSAYRTALEPGAMDRINRTWDRDALWRDQLEKTPAKFAEFMVDRTAGIWGRKNRSEAARSTMGGMLYQFRSYELNWLSSLHQAMWHLGPEGKVSAAMMLGGLGLMAGSLGLPFSKDIESAYEWVYKTITGVDPNLNEKFLEWAKTDPLGFGPNAGKTVLYGAEPFGVDIGPGLSFGDLASRNMESPLDLAGAAASIFLGAPMNAYKRYASGQSAASVFAESLPAAAKNLVKAFGVYPEEGVRSLGTGRTVVRPEDITSSDQGLRAIGLTSAPIGDAYREEERDYRLGQQNTQTSQAFNRQIEGLYASAAIAERRGDHAKAATLRQQAVGIMHTMPRGMKASGEGIRNAVIQATNPHAAAVRQAPKEVRPQVQQPIFGQP